MDMDSAVAIVNQKKAKADYDRFYYKLNQPSIRERHRIRYHENIDAERERNRIYRENNKEKEKERKRQYRLKIKLQKEKDDLLEIGKKE